MQRLNEVLLEPGDGLRDLLARGAGGDEAPELRSVRTCQQAENDFLLDQRRQAGNQCRLPNSSTSRTSASSNSASRTSNEIER